MNTEELKAVAGKACIKVFKTYSWDDVSFVHPELKLAWEVGQVLSKSK